jgi:hypothetical protein
MKYVISSDDISHPANAHRLAMVASILVIVLMSLLSDSLQLVAFGMMIHVHPTQLTVFDALAHFFSLCVLRHSLNTGHTLHAYRRLSSGHGVSVQAQM